MRWNRTIQTVDVHCAGEIGRVITGGVLNIPGATMAEKLHHMNSGNDDLRRWLCSEPRSGPAGSFCLLVPACDPQADVGLIILQPDQAHAMSGSNAMCATTALLETGMVPMVEPVSVVTFDTAAGLVKATATCAGGKVVKVTLDMPPSFVMARDAVIDTPVWGPVRYDLCFGGIFYALIEDLRPDHCPRERPRLGDDRGRSARPDCRSGTSTAPHDTRPERCFLCHVPQRRPRWGFAYLHHAAPWSGRPVALRHGVKFEHGVMGGAWAGKAG